MGWLDIVIVVTIIVSTFVGLKTGIIKAAMSLAGLIVGVIVAGRYYVPFADRLTFIDDYSMAKIAAFAIIFIGILIAARLLAQLLKQVASAILLGWVDRLVGAIFGFFLGSIFWGAVLAMWVKFLGMGDTVAESALAPVILNYFPLVLGLLPAEFDTVRSFF